MDVVKWFQLKYYQYNLSTALYMLEPWERLAFNIVVLVLVVSASYTTYNYTPVYLSDLAHSASAYLPAIAGVSEHVGHP